MIRLRVGLSLPFPMDCPGKTCLENLVKTGLDDVEILYEIRCSPNIWDNRNRIVAGLNQCIHQKVDYDYVLQLDRDIVFKVSDVKRLLGKSLPIVSGAYRRKDNPKVYHAGFWEEPGVRSREVTDQASGMSTVDWVGGGFLMVRQDAFTKMEYPWWRSNIVRRGECAEATSADIGFCMGAASVGLPIYLDVDCEVCHL